MMRSDFFHINEFCTKQSLYVTIQRIREIFEIDSNQYPLNYRKFLSRFNRLSYMETNFDSKSICGVLIKNEREKSAMFLNKKLNESEKNFSAFHETIHYLCHNRNVFHCDSKMKIKNDSLEWQANEGAAEFLVPYRLFIPDFVNRCYKNNNFSEINEILAKKYNVTTAVIDFRINSLAYEIKQFLQKTPLDLLEIKSANYQKSHGIITNLRQYYCSKCKSRIEYFYNYCPICGQSFLDKIFCNKIEGVLPMHYIDRFLRIKDGKIIYCPRCGNEDISSKANYCKICGLKLNNTCTNPKCENYSEGLSFFSRFCFSCGYKSDYFDKNILKSWDNVQEQILIEEIGASEIIEEELSLEAQKYIQDRNIVDDDDDLPPF